MSKQVAGDVAFLLSSIKETCSNSWKPEEGLYGSGISESLDLRRPSLTQVEEKGKKTLFSAAKLVKTTRFVWLSFMFSNIHKNEM